VSDRLLIGAQNICKPLEADTGERLLPNQLIVCRREILSSMCVIHPVHMAPKRFPRTFLSRTVLPVWKGVGCDGGHDLTICRSCRVAELNVPVARYCFREAPLQRGATERIGNMRTITKAALVLGFVGAMSASAFERAQAQGVYYSGPGINVQVGEPDWRYREHRRYYRNYDGPYAYAPAPRYRRGCPWGFSVQDGVCKPYRGY
jgi:hypothetical protein